MNPPHDMTAWHYTWPLPTLPTHILCPSPLPPAFPQQNGYPEWGQYITAVYYREGRTSTINGRCGIHGRVHAAVGWRGGGAKAHLVAGVSGQLCVVRLPGGSWHA
jgi:hypothetical protein